MFFFFLKNLSPIIYFLLNLYKIVRLLVVNKKTFLPNRSGAKMAKFGIYNNYFMAFTLSWLGFQKMSSNTVLTCIGCVTKIRCLVKKFYSMPQNVKTSSEFKSFNCNLFKRKRPHLKLAKFFYRSQDPDGSRFKDRQFILAAYNRAKVTRPEKSITSWLLLSIYIVIYECNVCTVHNSV